MMKTSATVGTIAAALAKAQKAMAGAKKDSTNPHFKSKYADLASVVDAIKEALAANSICYVQTPCTNDKQEVGVETLLAHESGEWIAGDPFYVPVQKADAQGFGSALTYCRRYSLAAICGVAPEDDDGNAAAKAKPEVDNTAVELAKSIMRKCKTLDELAAQWTAIPLDVRKIEAVQEAKDKQKADLMAVTA